jgi:hypothetical protein
MTATPFALVCVADRDKVLAYGMEIELASGREVVTFRRESNGQTMFGVHQSVEAACRRFNGITPVELVWE